MSNVSFLDLETNETQSVSMRLKREMKILSIKIYFVVTQINQTRNLSCDNLQLFIQYGTTAEHRSRKRITKCMMRIAFKYGFNSLCASLRR